MNGIALATESISVTTPELPGLGDADYVIGLLESNGIYNNKVLVNRVRVDMIQQYDMLSVYDGQETLGIPLLGAIPEDKTIISATNCGEPLVLQNQFNVAGLCFEMISRKLVGKNETVLDLNNYLTIINLTRFFICFKRNIMLLFLMFVFNRYIGIGMFIKKFAALGFQQ
jgi:septum site-determining protein MinD